MRSARSPESRRVNAEPLSGLGFGVWVLGFGFWGLGFGFWVWGLGFGFWVLGFGLWAFECRVSGVGCRFSGVGFRVSFFGSNRRSCLRVDARMESLGREPSDRPRCVARVSVPACPCHVCVKPLPTDALSTANRLPIHCQPTPVPGLCEHC
jgi:hypothetical protein